MGDLQEGLKKLFPAHKPSAEPEKSEERRLGLQAEPIVCKYEKKGRGGKAVTLLEGYTGTASDFKALTKTLQSRLGAGGSTKGDAIIIQGAHRDKIMEILREMGFNTKRVGG